MPNGPNMPIMPKLIGHSLKPIGPNMPIMPNMPKAYWAY